MNTPAAASKGLRLRRVGETMEATDVMFNPFGERIPIRPAMIGNKVLGERHAPGNADSVYCERKRRPAKSEQGT